MNHGRSLFSVALLAWTFAVISSTGKAARAQSETATGQAPSNGVLSPRAALSADNDLIEVRSGGLTADEVALRAVSASPTLAARRARIDAATAQVEKVTAQFFPRITLSATYTRLSAAENSMGGALVGAQNPGLLTAGPCPAELGTPAGSSCILDSQGAPLGAAALEFPSARNSCDASVEVGVPISDYFLTMHSAIAATRASARSRALSAQLAEQEVRHEARLAYYAWLRSVAATSVTDRSLMRSKALRDDTQAALDLGTATRADMLRVAALVSNTQLQVHQARKMRQLAAARLAMLMDEPPRDYFPGQNLPHGRREPAPRASAEASFNQQRLSQLVTEAQLRRLELASLDEGVNSIRQAEQANGATRLPRLDGFAQLSHAKPNQRYMLDTDHWHTSWAAGLRLSYTINDTFTGGADSKELKAQRAELEAERRQLELAIRLQVTDAYLESQRAGLAIDAANDAHRAAAEAYRVSRELYSAGRATTSELIAAVDDLSEASLQQVNATITLEVAQLQLQHVLGRNAA